MRLAACSSSPAVWARSAARACAARSARWTDGPPCAAMLLLSPACTAAARTAPRASAADGADEMRRMVAFSRSRLSSRAARPHSAATSPSSPSATNRPRAAARRVRIRLDSQARAASAPPPGLCRHDGGLAVEQHTAREQSAAHERVRLSREQREARGAAGAASGDSYGRGGVVAHERRGRAAARPRARSVSTAPTPSSRHSGKMTTLPRQQPVALSAVGEHRRRRRDEVSGLRPRGRD